MFSTKSTKTVVAALLLIAVASITLIAPATAQLDGTETVYYNNTTAIDDTTTDIQVTVGGTNESDVYINYYRVHDNGTETLDFENATVSSVTNINTSHQYAVQTDNTTAYRVIVHDDGTALPAADVGDISVETLSDSGGGGATSSSSLMSIFLNPDGTYNKIRVGVLLALIGGILMTKGDDNAR